MNSLMRRFLLGWTCCALLTLSAPGFAQTPAQADDILLKAFQHDGGTDTIARITFTFTPSKAPGFTYYMAWKRYTQGDILSKILMFKESPPEGRGTGYLSTFYKPQVNKADEEWLYMPELRMTRKLSHTTQKSEKEEEYAPSELRQYDLEPRDPTLDSSQLLRTEALDEVECYVIESIPRPHPPTIYPYTKVIRWISRDNHLPLRIDHYGEDEQLIKRQTLTWRKIKNVWVWDEVIGENLRTGAKTTLKMSDVRVNLGLPEMLFSKRSLERGASAMP